MKSIHHSFDIDLATKYGVHEAILIHHFQHWIRLNQKRGKNLKEGRTWSYQTIEEIADNFPYFSFEQVRELVERLCTGKNRKSKKDHEFDPVIIKGNFNKSSFDRTIWYAFIDEDAFLNNSYERGNPQMDKGISPFANGDIPRPIPDTKPDTKEKPLPPTSRKEKKSQSPESLEDWKKRMISLGWTEEEFDQAYKEFLSKAAGSIKNPKKWLDTVLQSVRDLNRKRDDMIRTEEILQAQRKEFLEKKDREELAKREKELLESQKKCREAHIENKEFCKSLQGKYWVTVLDDKIILHYKKACAWDMEIPYDDSRLKQRLQLFLSDEEVDLCQT